ncbi:MAG: GntR family transcriptional regulator [Rhodobacter sp. CACIA14H1]|nr:MAG: GntR family transcriptional regulator [Rhodobacter sp. CACIA14H1]
MTKESFLIQSSLADQAREALRDQIISGKLPPNARIDLHDLAQQWNISPTPLRDAVKALESSGLVEIQPRRGVFVAGLDRKGLRETFELRMAFEGMAARLAAVHLPDGLAADAGRRYRAAGAMPADLQETALQEVDTLVHDIVRDNCGNSRLIRLMEGVRDLVQWSRQTIIRHVPESFAASLPEHLAICDALAARHADGAERAMRIHLDGVLARIEDYLDAHGTVIA